MLLNSIRRPAQIVLASAGLWLAASTAFASAPQVLPPSDLPYGLSYQEWSAKWWQWNLGRNTNKVAFVGNPEICQGPGTRVRFLLGAPGPITTTRKVSVATGTPLFFCVLSAEADNVDCPVFTSYTADQLAAEAEGNWSAVSETTCTLDGVAVPGLDNPTNSEFLVLSPAFSYTTSEKGNAVEEIQGVTCVPGDATVYPAVAEGIYIMLAPLSRGKHTIHTVAVVGPASAPYFTQDITYDITVVPE